MAGKAKETPVDIVNKLHKESTIYEINEALAKLADSISKTQATNKALITEHFSKFVECRSLMENIWVDIKNKGLDKPLTEETERHIAALSNKYSKIIEDVSESVVEDSYSHRQIYYRNEFYDIFTMHEELSKNLTHFEAFVEIYKRARKSYERVKKSKFMQSKFAEIKPLLRKFLDNVYIFISSDKITYEDICYHFDIYCSISEARPETKLMNTLLVAYKEATYVRRECSEEYINYLCLSLSRLVKYASSVVAVEGIYHFFECLEIAVAEADIEDAKMVIKKIKDLEEYIVLPVNCKKLFDDANSEFRLKMFENTLKRTAIKEVAGLYSQFSALLRENEREKAQDLILEYAKEFVQKLDLAPYDYLHSEESEVDSIRPCLGVESSKRNKKLNKFLSQFRDQVLEKLALDFSKTVEEKGECHVLMEAVHIIKRTPKFHKKIIFEAKDSILKNPVIYFYLSKYILMERPKLEGEDADKADALRAQFDFFLL
ncbi:hypothetical protein ENBRE01_0212 [Enteropsectra breve]|nr:hypothetical protein ENBRE01_0212 [Enteropsectra breve]